MSILNGTEIRARSKSKHSININKSSLLEDGDDIFIGKNMGETYVLRLMLD